MIQAIVGGVLVFFLISHLLERRRKKELIRVKEERECVSLQRKVIAEKRELKKDRCKLKDEEENL